MDDFGASSGRFRGRKHVHTQDVQTMVSIPASEQKEIGHVALSDDVRRHILENCHLLSTRLQVFAGNQHAAAPIPSTVSRRTHSRVQHDRLPPSRVVVVSPKTERPVGCDVLGLAFSLFTPAGGRFAGHWVALSFVVCVDAVGILFSLSSIKYHLRRFTKLR